MLVTTEIGTKQLADLIKQVQAGDEILLTQNSKPVARILPATESKPIGTMPLRIRSLAGHRVLTTTISQQELGEDMFD